MTTIHVTADHIARGVPGEATCCPVTLAIMDALPATGVVVGPTEISIWPDDLVSGAWVEFESPGDVRLFVMLYDTTGAAEPFSFELPYPAVTT
jgi:hypothetical protein